MQTAQRHHEPDLIRHVFDAPYRFRFAQLLNILLRKLRQEGVPYEQAFRHVLRFRNSLSLAFPASEVEAVRMELAAMPGRGHHRRVHITPAFIGLLGVSGTLPLHDTERMAATLTGGFDESRHAFIDLFSNRMVGLFYEAWGKYRVEHGLDVRTRDDLLPMLSALSGVRRALPEAVSGGGVHEETVSYYAGLLRSRPVSAVTVARVLTDYFNVPVRIEEFVGGWDAIPPAMRSTLGRTNPQLGRGAPLGTRVWRNDMRVRLHVGPLNRSQMEEFVPRGRAWHALADMLRLFAVPSIQYEVRLLLDPSCVRLLTLITGGSDQKRLGWNTHLTSTEGVAQRPDIRAMLKP